MSPTSQTVFIVDDDPSVCRSLSRLVRQAGHEVFAFDTAEDFLATQTSPMRQPACLVVDLHLPGLSGLELQQRLSAGHASFPLIFISGNGDIPATVLAMKQGAVTFLTKPFDDEELLQAIAEALEQHRANLESAARVGAIRDRMNQLTEREREVMSWVITGALNKQIAAALSIVEKTVKVHRARVLEKMKVASVAELVRLCGLVGFEAAKERPARPA